LKFRSGKISPSGLLPAYIHEVAEGDFPKGKGLKARSVNKNYKMKNANIKF